MSTVTGGYEMLGKQMKEPFLRLKWDATGRARYLSGSLELASRQIGKIFQDLTEWVKVGNLRRLFNAYAIKSGIKSVCERVA